MKLTNKKTLKKSEQIKCTLDKSYLTQKKNALFDEHCH